MKIVNITEDDIVDSITGINVTVWFAGCDIQCSGCHNKELWDPSKFPDSSREEILEKVIKAMAKPPKQRGLSILGGEPFAPWNKEDVAYLVDEVRKVYPDAKIYCWTGHIYEDIKEDPIIKPILSKLDYLIDGPYIESLKGTYKLRGSSNQRIIENPGRD